MIAVQDEEDKDENGETKDLPRSIPDPTIPDHILFLSETEKKSVAHYKGAIHQRAFFLEMCVEQVGIVTYPSHICHFYARSKTPGESRIDGLQRRCTDKSSDPPKDPHYQGWAP